MRRVLRRAALTTLKTGGVFNLVKNSEWRRCRLLILCYHGVSLEDEHQWRPNLYVSPQQFERRLEILRTGNFSVLPLGEALERLYRGDLPPRSVVLTFDDGAYDFYQQAYPLLKERSFPATVYLTTYYSDVQRPVFGLMGSYILWKARNCAAVDLCDFGVKSPCSLDLAETRQHVLDQLLRWINSEHIRGEQKDEILASIAQRLRIDYAELRSKRILQLMNRREVKQLSDCGVDFQLHTHRHRTPLDRELFRLEIRENRTSLAGAVTGMRKHFCYPSGAYRPEFLAWLSAEQIVSATTCDTGFAVHKSHPLLLPRLVDTSGRSDLEFESWLAGVGHFLSRRKRGQLAFTPNQPYEG